MNKLRWETNVQNGVCSIDFDRKDIEMNKMIVTTLESKYRLYDMRTFNSKKGYTSLTQQVSNTN